MCTVSGFGSRTTGWSPPRRPTWPLVSTWTAAAKFWQKVLADLRNRGVKDVLVACCDGINGFRGVNAAYYQFETRQHELVTALKEAREQDFPRSEIERIRGEAVGLGFSTDEFDQLLPDLRSNSPGRRGWRPDPRTSWSASTGWPNANPPAQSTSASPSSPTPDDRHHQPLPTKENHRASTQYRRATTGRHGLQPSR
jgi:hypothetical protein